MSSRSKAHSALAQLKASRAGEKRSKQWQKTEANKSTDIYDEVDERVYKSIVKDRLQQDDFVVGDEGYGYADNGEERWGQDEGDYEEEEANSEEERKQARRAYKQALKASSATSKPKKPKREQSSSPPPAQPSASSYKKVVPKEQEDEFLKNLLSGMDAEPVIAPMKSRPPMGKKRKSSPMGYAGDQGDEYDSAARTSANARFAAYRNGSTSHVPSSDPADPYDYDNGQSLPKRVKLEFDSSDDGFGFGDHDADFSSDGGAVDVDINMDGGEKKTATKKVKKEEDFDFGDDEFDDIDFGNLQFDSAGKMVDDTKKPIPKSNYQHPTSTKTDITKIKKLDDSQTPAWLAIKDALQANTIVDTSAEFDSLGPLKTSESSTSQVNTEAILEEDGSLRFFWLDYLELGGRVYLVGKALERNPNGNGGRWVSCCVTVNGIERNLFCKPRQWALDEYDEETDVVPTEKAIRGDFDKLRKEHKVGGFGGKMVERRHVFDEPGDGDKGGKTKYYKVVYGFDQPQIPIDSSTPNIERIYGTNTSAFEMLVIKRKIMGPCWLEVKNPEVSNKGISWCKLEVEVSDPKELGPFAETDAQAPRDMPPLTVMSFSLRTIINHLSNQREIVCATARFWEDVNVEEAMAPERLPSAVHTVVRCLDKFPVRFEEQARAERSKIVTMTQEKALLSSLLAMIKKYDPDVIVGHEFAGVSLDILLHRLKQLKVEPWSCVGRFKRAKWPPIGKQGTNMKFLNGRLMCDLSSDAGKSMITSTTWSLTEMSSGHLGITREDIDPEDTATFFDSTVSSPDRLMSFVRHCERDAYLQMAIATKVQMLALTKQLTNLAGNAWNKTLNGGRAERNEYILLHEFHRLKYICPDKTYGKKASTAAARAEAQEGEANDGAAVGTTTKGKKDKYKGGLVFEPKRGLWDKYILVMDFNSLYPSIIQEYNIDFTTVVKEVIEVDGEEKIPDIPAPDVPQGVLPRLIANLVQRRRAVKGLMKDPKASEAKLMQWDIKQQALKLTANSMYGCLGFEYSRFYARPLAALTTFKGREILTHTRELAESLSLDVVYGDTDSVFVNSNADNFPDALKMANMFKKQVNNRYKLLEIDLDGVFQRVLLLQKKKYAAVKVKGPNETTIEVKGLDMKRREYSALSKNVSKKVLDFILSGQPTEEVVEEIHEYLRSVGTSVRDGKVTLEDLTIFKRLGKDPEAYPDAKSQPHVQVALRMKSRGGTAKAGDVIPYLFCLGPDGQSSRTAQADRARHPDEVRRGGDDVKIDYEFYLSQQVLPPIERLCDPIAGTDRSRIAECLGMDPSKFQTYNSSNSQEVEFTTLESLIPDKERFKDVDLFLVKCKKCEGTYEFTAVGHAENPILTSSGVHCPSCSHTLTGPRALALLELQIRQHISRYYDSWTICDEQTCQSRTRSMNVYGRRCLQPECGGSVRMEYTSLQLYNQLLYYASLFNATKALNSCPSGSDRLSEVQGVIKNNEVLIQSMASLVEKYLNECGRRWIGLGGLFSFMKI